MSSPHFHSKGGELFIGIFLSTMLIMGFNNYRVPKSVNIRFCYFNQ